MSPHGELDEELEAACLSDVSDVGRVSSESSIQLTVGDWFTTCEQRVLPQGRNGECAAEVMLDRLGHD